MTSTPVYTSTAEGFRDAKEIAGLRPMAEPKPRAPRKAPVKRAVTNGIVCFCGERFELGEAREFMIHLRAEVGDDLAILERHRKAMRECAQRRRTDPEYQEWREQTRAADRARNALRRTDPEYQEHKRALDRERSAQIKALHGAGDHSRCSKSSCAALMPPETRTLQNARARELAAEIKSLHSQGDHSRCMRRCAGRRELDAS